MAFSSVGGFFNNQPTTSPINENFHPSQQFNLYNKQQPRQSTPAPVYERDHAGVSNTYLRNQGTTTSKPITTNSYYTGGGAFISNAKFSPKPETLYNYGVDQSQDKTTKKPNYHIQKLIPIDIPTPKFNKLEAPPAYNQNFNFNKFINNIRETHLSQIDPNTMQDSLKFIGANAYRNATYNYNNNLNKINYAPSSTQKPKINSEEFYYDEQKAINNNPQIIKTINENEKFVKPTVNILKTTNNKIKSKPIETNEEDDENIDGDDEYYDDDEEDEEEYKKFIPNKSKYSPMSETMAPKVKNNTIKSTTPLYTRNNLYGYSTPTVATTRKSIIDFKYDATTQSSISITTSNIPPIIKFPDDVFQGIKANIPRYSVNRTSQTSGRIAPNIVRPRINRPTQIDTKYVSTTVPNTITTTDPTPISTTTKKIYTIRPNRGNSKWRTAKPSTRILTNKQNLELDEKLPNR